MGELFHARQSRVGNKNSGSGGGGVIVEVQGGHIVRSISRKDRHSKVCTSKGPKDRRVRLSANTAIQFYDVQDRLGYDRPSKAVDWLIKKAKSAIDELDQLPPWKPTSSSFDFDQNPLQDNTFGGQETANFVSSLNFDHNPVRLSQFQQHPDDQNSNFLSDQTTPFLQTLFDNTSQRGPLQSSYTPSIRGWIEQTPFTGGFSGFSDKPSSASSDSRH